MNIIRHTPVANQVNEVLRQRMLEGDYLPGARLPSESELSKEFGVSRATVRTVLARMEAEGLILRKQGDGTYVNEHIQDVNTHLGGLWEFSRLIESSGYKPTIQSLEISTRPATPEEVERLHLGPGEPVVWMQRLFLADQRPVILANNAIPYHFIDTSQGELVGSYPIQKFLKTFCHKKIAYAILDIGANTIPAGEARLLELADGQPLLNIYITFYDRDNRPLVCGSSYFNDAALRLRLVQAWG